MRRNTKLRALITAKDRKDISWLLKYLGQWVTVSRYLVQLRSDGLINEKGNGLTPAGEKFVRSRISRFTKRIKL
jgi:hypothetical protein